MPKSRAPYPPEFRAEAIRLVRSSGKPMAQLARELDVTNETLDRSGGQERLSQRQ